MRAHADRLVVGDNQPYSGQLVAYSFNRPGGGHGLPHCAIEIRQDLAADDVSAARWRGSSNRHSAPFWQAPDCIASDIIEW